MSFPENVSFTVTVLCSAQSNVGEHAPWYCRDRLETRELVAEAESGSTATVLFARPDRLVLAYVGDSRAVRNQLINLFIFLTLPRSSTVCFPFDAIFVKKGVISSLEQWFVEIV